MPKYMCKRTTVADRLYEGGKIYVLPSAPNKHFQELESPKAEMERNKGVPLKSEAPKADKKDDKTLDLMGDQGKEKSLAGETPKGEKKDGRKTER